MESNRELEEAAQQFAITIQTRPGTLSRLNAIEWFKAGANWQTERMEKSKPDDLLFNKDWESVKTTLAVNFLRLPEDHQRDLIKGIQDLRPDLFNNKTP